MTKDQILAEARALDPKQREELIDDLRQIHDDGQLAPEQRAELTRRLAAIDRGEATFVPGEQVMRELRERVRRREAEFERGAMSTSPVDEVVDRVRSRARK